MIRQRFILEKYDWLVWVYYAVDDYYVDEILERLKSIGCSHSFLREAESNMSNGKMNTGLTYSNLKARMTVMVIGLADSPEEYENSITHERRHLEAHISKRFGLDPYGEDVAYLVGDISYAMHPISKKFVCEHCIKSLKHGGKRGHTYRED